MEALAKESVDRVSAAAEAEIAKLVPPKKGGPHPMAYAFIAAVAAFSGVAAWVLLSKPQQQIVYVTQSAAPVASTATAPGSAAAVEASTGEVQVAASGSAPKKWGKIPGAGSATSAPVAAGANTGAPLDTGAFQSTIPGPTAKEAPPPAAGGQLTQGEIMQVVSSQTANVKRKCWQPALEGRAGTGPASAKVRVSITIGASGSVESAKASGGEKDFPGLSACIAGRVQGWKFPPSGGSTPVEVPFHFAGQ